MLSVGTSTFGHCQNTCKPWNPSDSRIVVIFRTKAFLKFVSSAILVKTPPCPHNPMDISTLKAFSTPLSSDAQFYLKVRKIVLYFIQ